MLVVVYGGSGSGKSEYAEQVSTSLNQANLYYIATMQPLDQESEKKIERHRQMRKDKHFETIECFTNIGTVKIPGNSTVLLECMSNLVANEMFSENGAKENTFNCIKEGILLLLDQVENLIIVTNNVYEDGQSFDEFTLNYLDTLAKVNQYISNKADKVVEVVHGITIPLKNK